MGTLAHSAHFGELATRLNLTRSFAVGDLPLTFVMLDDSSSVRDYCLLSPADCAEPRFTFLTLENALGQQSYENVREHYFGSGPRVQRSGKCSQVGRRAGQQYQGLKKFYLANAVRDLCQILWVSDAESFPFRSFNITEMAELVQPTVYTSHWFGKCSWTHSWWGDEHCHVQAFEQLALDRAAWFDGALTAALVHQHAVQSMDVWGFNSWWNYNPEMIALMMSRVETQSASSFAEYWLQNSYGESQFWNQHAEYFGKVNGSHFPVVNWMDVLQREAPAFYAACCNCNVSRACADIPALWSECAVSAGLTAGDASRLIIDQLGMFSLHGWKENFAGRSLVLDDQRLSWCHNNCMNEDMYRFLSEKPGIQLEVIQARRASFSAPALDRYPL